MKTTPIAILVTILLVLSVHPTRTQAQSSVVLYLGAYDADSSIRLPNTSFSIDTTGDGLPDVGPYLTDSNGWYTEATVGITDLVMPSFRLVTGQRLGGGVLALRLQGHQAAKSVITLEVFDLKGRCLASASGLAHGSRIQITRPLAGGAYFARVRTSTDSAVARILTSGERAVRCLELQVESTPDKWLPIDGSEADVRLFISRDGYSPVEVDEHLVGGETYWLDYGLNEQTGISQTLVGDAWDLLNENALYGGTVSIRNATGDVFTTSVDSSYSLDYTVAVQDEELKIWFDLPGMSRSGAAYPQDGLVVRDRFMQAANFVVSDDTMTVSADHPSLQVPVRYQAVDDIWDTDPNFRGLLTGYHRTRGEDRPGEDGAWTQEVLLREYDGSTDTYGYTISPQDSSDLLEIAQYKSCLLGPQPNGTQIADVYVLTVDTFTWELDRAQLYIDNTTGPGNGPFTIDGYIEDYHSHTRSGSPIGLKASEMFEEELADIGGTNAVAFDGEPDDLLNNLGKAALNAHYLFDDGTQFD